MDKSRWHHQVFQGSFHLKRRAVPLNLTWVNFSATKGHVHPGQVKRHNLPLTVEAVLKYLVVPFTFAHDCTYLLHLCTDDATFLGGEDKKLLAKR